VAKRKIVVDRKKKFSVSAGKKEVKIGEYLFDVHKFTKIHPLSSVRGLDRKATRILWEQQVLHDIYKKEYDIRERAKRNPELNRKLIKQKTIILYRNIAKIANLEWRLISEFIRHRRALGLTLAEEKLLDSYRAMLEKQFREFDNAAGRIEEELI